MGIEQIPSIESMGSVPLAIVAVFYLLVAGWGAGRLSIATAIFGGFAGGAIFATLGGFVLGWITQGVQGGLLGGALAGILHSIYAAIFFSGSSAFDFVAVNFSERIVWALTCGISICVGLLFSLANRCGQSIAACDTTA